MKLTGLQIFKLLPNKNCKECGFQTCLAFAMKLAAKQAKLDACPYVSDEAKAKLGAAAAPPIRLVEIGTGERIVRIGEELVMFRHEKTFFHKSALAAQVDDSMERSDLLAKLDRTCLFSVERAGERLALDLIAIKETSGNPEKFAETVKTVREKCGLPLVLISKSIPCLNTALETAGNSRPLLWGADSANVDDMAALAKKHSVPLVVETRGGIDELAKLACRIEQAGVSDILLAPLSDDASARLRDFTLLRRRALSRSVPGTGFPLIMSARGGDYAGAAATAGGICKYASIIVIEEPATWEYLPLLTLRQNIYTDPQKPLQVSPGIYNIGEAAEDSPLLVTTNFSLTYFMVSTEIEASEIPSRLLVADAEGQSVLTAWAAGKFNAESIAKAVADNGIEASTSHKRIIIPGYVATISGDLEDKLPGWNVMVGPQESADIPAYMKEVWARATTEK